MSLHKQPTAKQGRFIAEYLIDLNATQAAIRAGFSSASARHTASRLLQMPHIKTELQRRQAEQLKKAGITAEAVLEQLRHIAFFDPAAIYDDERRLKHPKDWPAEARVALSSFDIVARNLTAGDGSVDQVVKIRLESKLQALEMLAKHFGLLTEKPDVNQNIQIIQWLPLEPPPPLPAHEQRRLDSHGAPFVPGDTLDAEVVPPGKNGSAPGPPGPTNRTLPSGFSDSEEDLNAEVGNSGMSLRAQRRCFPEMRREKRKV